MAKSKAAAKKKSPVNGDPARTAIPRRKTPSREKPAKQAKTPASEAAAAPRKRTVKGVAPTASSGKKTARSGNTAAETASRPTGTAHRKPGKVSGTATPRKAQAKSKDVKASPRTMGLRSKPAAALMKPQQPDAILAAVVGAEPMSRTQVIEKLWSYIDAKGLQDSQNRRMINADELLRHVFGDRKQVSMFEVAQLVNQHLTEA